MCKLHSVLHDCIIARNAFKERSESCHWLVRKLPERLWAPKATWREQPKPGWHSCHLASPEHTIPAESELLNNPEQSKPWWENVTCMKWMIIKDRWQVAMVWKVWRGWDSGPPLACKLTQPPKDADAVVQELCHISTKSWICSTHAPTCTPIHTSTHTHRHIHMHAYTRIHAPTHMHVYTPTYTHRTHTGTLNRCLWSLLLLASLGEVRMYIHIYSFL